MIVSWVIKNRRVGEAGFQIPRFFYFVCESIWVFGIVHFISKFYFACSLARSACDS